MNSKVKTAVEALIFGIIVNGTFFGMLYIAYPPY